VERVALYPAAGLAPDARRFEAKQPALVRPGELFGVIYKDLAAELRHELARPETPVVPVFPFAYDWRQDNRLTMRLFAQFVAEAIERTNLLRRKSGVPVCGSVDVVGHSMGGLVIAGALGSGLLGSGEKCLVRRVVSLGTPFRGAVAAIAKIAAGAGPLFGRSGREREREMARVTPSVYQLLPTYRGALLDDKGRALDPGEIFDPGVFQHTVIRGMGDTIAAQHADEGLAISEERRLAEGRRLLKDMLDGAREFRAIVERFRPDGVLPRDGGWLPIVGVGESTMIDTVLVRDRDGNRWFDFRASLRDRWDEPETAPGASKFQTGDETVPLRGALPPWDEEGRRVVIVRRRDFGWPFEAFDSTFAATQGLHAALPLMNLAQRWTISMFRGARHGLLRSWRAPGVPSLGELVARFGPLIEGLVAKELDAEGT
jgi:hypothetical protein